MRFHWGDFVLDGVMSALTEDIDLFSSTGVPLRSKVSVTIKEQDPRFTALELPPGANSGADRRTPGQAPAGRGSDPGDTPANRTAEALAGESPAEFAARNGVDPAAWRSVAEQARDALDLPTGAEIEFSAGLTAAAGLGGFVGAAAGVDEPLAARVGLEESRTGQAAAFALTGAGGVGAAINAVVADEVGTAAASAAAAFQVSAPPSPARVSGRGGTAPGGAAPAPPATAAPARLTAVVAVDERATSFGRGVPLRPRRVVTTDIVSGSQGTAGLPPSTRDPSVPGWEALRAARLAEVAAADRGRVTGPCRHTRGCGCGEAGR